MVSFRREVIECGSRLLLDCIQTTFSHTYISITFLMMYGTMWSLGIHFDTRFFALAACMLGYMRLSIVDFFSYAVRYLVYYIAAKKRIEVRMEMSDISDAIFSFLGLIDISSSR